MGQPWGMCFINSDELLLTEKSGKLFRYIISTNTKTEITGLPAIASVGQGGLLDVAIHPEFKTNKYVYMSYSISGSGGYTLAVGRWVLQNNQLTSYKKIFEAGPFKSGTNHFGSRIAFDAQNRIYFSSSERQEEENAQLLSNHLGKIIRLNDDGTVPNDNPFVGVSNAKAEIFTYGHRNPQGIVIHPRTGKIYAHEHGPRGGDELNLIESGKNYGWPSITFGIDYDGTIISEDTAKPGMEQPIRYWVPSIAPCGMAILPLQNQQEGEVNFLVGALAGTQIQWVKVINDKHIETKSFMHNYARFRDVEVAPDGKIYALTETPNRLILLKTNQLITSIDDKEELQSTAVLYPNPAKDFVQINTQDILDESVSIQIYTSQGVFVKSLGKNGFTYNTDGLKVNVSDLESGMYVLELVSSTGSKSFKWNKL
jgi:aldose sugar dehydrogenase